MHFLKQAGLLTVLAQCSQAVALAAPAPAPAEDWETLLNNTNLGLAKRQEILNAGTLFGFAGGGCSTAGGIQYWTLRIPDGCQAVSNVGSAAWTEKAPG